MPTFQSAELATAARSIFTAAGARDDDAQIVARALVEANLAGHDSHGVMRIPSYVGWMEEKLINLSAEFKIVIDAEALAVVDGDWGFGQVMARKAMELGIEKASKVGAATISARNCAHIGRVGDYPIMAAEAGMVSIMFVNTHGAGRLVAPFGGIERRLSANPIAVGIPRPEGGPIVVDVSTCVLAEGKLRNFRTAGEPVPEGAIIDAEGRPTTDASDFYGPPRGAILPVGAHKGFALGLAADILAGALSGAGCARPDAERVGNSFLVTIIDIRRFRDRSDFDRDVLNLVDFVKSSKLAEGFSEILVAGEPEARTKEQRERDGITVHPDTWQSIVGTGKKYGVDLSAMGS